MNGADPKTKASKIQRLVASGDLDEATKQLIDFAEDFSFKRELKRESVAIAGQYISLLFFSKMVKPSTVVQLKILTKIEK